MKSVALFLTLLPALHLRSASSTRGGLEDAAAFNLSDLSASEFQGFKALR